MVPAGKRLSAGSAGWISNLPCCGASRVTEKVSAAREGVDKADMSVEMSNAARGRVLEVFMARNLFLDDRRLKYGRARWRLDPFNHRIPPRAAIVKHLVSEFAFGVPGVAESR
jgi:hypothetical protein